LLIRLAVLLEALRLRIAPRGAAATTRFFIAGSSRL
jgi:hypothetical protein